MREKVLVALALVPAIALCIKIYRHDKIEKEPLGLLVKLLIAGVVSAIIAIILEIILENLLNRLVVEESLFKNFLLYFFVVGFSEEFAKYIMLKWASYKSKDFNFTFDAIVYSVFVAMGFAAFENVGYVLIYGFETGILRAITAVPMHAVFGVFMGIYYAGSKLYQHNKRYKVLSVLVPMLIHGTYDFIASLNMEYSILIFIGFLVIIYASANSIINKSSRNDRYIS